MAVVKKMAGHMLQKFETGLRWICLDEITSFAISDSLHYFNHPVSC